ncbi:STM2901 family protein [Pantoea sp. FN060301]|uniref:STM2901 family protein n=1 Tax=Pantoea sp. FN060301 TaxID=3420380 RepID=UPI003D16EA1D
MDATEELNGTYFYHGHANLTPQELFNLILSENFANRTGLETTSAAMILAGQPWLPTRGKPVGATKGTSVASRLSRVILKDMRFPRGVSLYMPTGKNISTLKFTKTNRVAAFIGRSIPWLGYAEVVILLQLVAADTRRQYNLIARPKDRIAWASF